MSIADELNDLQTYLSNAYDNIQAKGGTIPQNKNMYNLADAIATITQGQIVIPPDAGTLTAINVTQLPTKTSYYVGEYFNPAGCVVMATYTNTTIDVSSVCTFIVNTPLQGTDTSVQVSYEGLTTSFSISVTYPPVPAPSGTLLLMHCDGNLINEVTGDMTNITGTYRQSQGKFDRGQGDYGVHLKNFYTENPTNWGFGWWTFASSLNHGNLEWQVESVQYTGHWNDLFLVADNNNNCYLTVGYGMDISSLVVDTTIPATDIHNNWVYYAVQIKGTNIYFYINGVQTSHATITKINKMNDIRNNSTGNAQPIDEIIIANADVYRLNNAPWYIQ